ncbi:hypothetical protein [Cupriavidus sp. TA19]
MRKAWFEHGKTLIGQLN